MISYLYITELFKAILSQSIVMQGNVYMCPRYGQELNTDEFNQVIKDLVRRPHTKEYPIALIMPPLSDVSLKDKNNNWERYYIDMFFLTNTYYTSANQVKSINKNTQTSQHSIEQDWHDMKVCARDFLLSLNNIADANLGNYTPFRLVHNDSSKKQFEPVSLNSNDRVSGVKLSFKIDIFNGCEIEDYQANIDWSLIDLPSLTLHQQHLH